MDIIEKYENLDENEKKVLLDKYAKIKLSGLLQILKIIKLVNRKSSFHPSELTAVGEIWDALSNILETVLTEEI